MRRCLTKFAAITGLFFAPPATAGNVAALCFVPGDNCTRQIVAEIAGAKSWIFMQAYTFTSPEIAAALVAARHRGLDVRAILDPSSITGSGAKGAHAAEALALAGVAVQIDRRHAIAHNKIIVIDGQRVITGSFNFSRSAQERNAENVVVLAGEAIARRFADNWLDHARHADPYSTRIR